MAIGHEIQTLGPEYTFPPTPIEEASKALYPEGQLRSPEEVAQALDFAIKAVKGMTREQDFIRALASPPAVDPVKERYNSNYWAEFGNYSGSRVHELRKYGLHGQPVDPLKLDAISLISQGPFFVHAELALQAHRRHQRGGMSADSATQVNSAFRDSLQDFIHTYPEASVEHLHAGLASGALLATEPDTRKTARRITDDAIRQAKHTAAFGQILDTLSEQDKLHYREANATESPYGISYVVGPDTKSPLYLEVTPSVHRLDIGGDNKAFAVEAPDHVIIHSLTSDAEFQRDRFFIPAEKAAQKADALAGLLQEARLAA